MQVWTDSGTDIDVCADTVIFTGLWVSNSSCSMLQIEYFFFFGVFQMERRLNKLKEITMWVLGIKRGWSDLVASTFSAEPSCQLRIQVGTWRGFG